VTTHAIALKRVCKSFARGKPVLRNVSLDIVPGEMVALIGASGSGKSTLIRSIAGLTPIDRGVQAGEIRILDDVIQQNGRVTRSAKKLRSQVGIVFQQLDLVPRLSVLTNVCRGFLGQTSPWRGAIGQFNLDEKRRAMYALSRVGMADHALKRGSALSDEQQQRAAIARTLVQGAQILIADEPIASLDPSSARRVMDILRSLNQQDGITVLVSLHQVEYALNYCPRTIALRDGEVVYDGPSSRLTPAFLGQLYGAESEELFLTGLQSNSKPEGDGRPAEPAVRDQANQHLLVMASRA